MIRQTDLSMAIDIETDYGQPQDPSSLLLTSICLSDGREFLFEGWNQPDWVVEALNDPKVECLLHGSDFDLQWFIEAKKARPTAVYDTLYAERLLTSGTGKGNTLADVSLRRLGITLDKTVRDEFKFGRVTERGKRYAMDDVRVLHPIRQQQMAELKSNGQLEALRIENSIGSVVAAMQNTGMVYDSVLMNELTPYVNAERERAAVKAWKALGLSVSYDMFSGRGAAHVNLSSGGQTLKALERVGIKLSNYKWDTLTRFVMTTDDPKKQELVAAILEYKKWDKVLSWNYAQYVNPFTGRVHTSYNPQGADTFRFTSRNPNLQNVTRPYGSVNLRNLFAAPKGWVVVVLDYSQIELKILAELTREPKYVNSFLNDIDMHVAMAEELLGVKLSGKKDPRRSLGKTANFGNVAYGGGPDSLIGMGLHYGLLIPPADAENYIYIIRNKNPYIEAWGRDVTAELKQKGYIQVPTGHRRYVPESEQRSTLARNTHIQMFAAAILKDSMEPIQRRLWNETQSGTLTLQVHDELGAICLEKEAALVYWIMKQEMERAGAKWLSLIPVTVDGYIYRAWDKDGPENFVEPPNPFI